MRHKMGNSPKCNECKFCRRIDGEWVCDNDESDNYGLETEYYDGCVDEVKKGGVTDMKWGEIAKWVSVAAAVSVGIYITKSPWCLWAFFIPAMC